MKSLGNNLFQVVSNPVPLNGSSFLRGAHHPHCDRHTHHLIWIGGHPYCLGCVCMYSGIVLGLGIGWLMPWSSIRLSEWFLLHIVLLVPTIIQPWMQRKLFKAFARTVLGISIGSYLVSGLFLVPPDGWNWLFRLLILIVFAVLYRVLYLIRARYTSDPCTNCPLGTYPTCDWNLPRLLAENNDPVLLAALRGDQ